VLFPSPKSTPTPARVVITGIGIVTALGIGRKKNSEGFREGRSAIRPVTLFDVSRQRSKIAAVAVLPAQLPATRLTEKHSRRLDRAAKFLLLAAHEAWTQSGWQPSENLPIVLGTTSGGMMFGEAYLRQTIGTPHSQRRQPSRVVHYNAQRPALDVCDAFGFQGPITIIANACASGANAIGHAFELVRSGTAERVFTGGYDALCQLTFAGFDSLQALSPTGCRPFDAKRDGLTLGEGAAMLTLENFENAKKRGAEILGEVIGYGVITDNHHLTQPHPQGDAACAAMNAACRVAGISPGQVDYVNAHGTATPQNDSTEALAINRWAGDRAPTLPVSSTKASIGHLLGAAGAVEAALTLMALREQWLPPQRNTGETDPACKFRVVREPTTAKVEIALSNSFGFGGANATLALRRWS
jgi:3-oxoacyl-[acyl-carrier-protein] synthase II